MKASYFPFFCEKGRTYFEITESLSGHGFSMWMHILMMLTTKQNHYVVLKTDSDKKYFYRYFESLDVPNLPVKIHDTIEILVNEKQLSASLWIEHKVLFSSVLVESLSRMYKVAKDKMPTEEKIIELLKNEESTTLFDTRDFEKPSRIKKKKEEKPEVLKNEVCEKVFLTKEETEKITEKIGLLGYNFCIQKLSAYKISSGKTYKSDYGAILNWVMDEFEKTTKGNNNRMDQLSKM